MNFLLDNNLSPHLAHALNELAKPDNLQVIHLRDRFAPDTPDVVWLDELFREGDWAIISGDRFDKSHLEQKAIKKNGLLVYQLKKAWSNHKHWSKAAQLVGWFPHLRDHAALTGNGAFLVGWQVKSKLQSV